MPLIAFEGGDGVGKATQSKRLADALRKKGHPIAFYSFPRYETDVGRAMRRHLLGETALVVMKRQDSEHEESCSKLDTMRQAYAVPCTCSPLRSSDDALAFQSLMLADKCDANFEISQVLARGGFVVCDRWTASALAYGASDGLDHGWLERIHTNLPHADVTFYLKVPESVAVGRRPVLRDRYEKDRGKQIAVARNYDELARTKPGWFVVDGSPSVDVVEASIWAIMEQATDL